MSVVFTQHLDLCRASLVNIMNHVNQGLLVFSKLNSHHCPIRECANTLYVGNRLCLFHTDDNVVHIHQ